jgi:hypothetical protein
LTFSSRGYRPTFIFSCIFLTHLLKLSLPTENTKAPKRAPTTTVV